MPLSLANSVCATNVLPFLSRARCRDWSERSLSGVQFGSRELFATGKCTVEFTAPNSPRRHGIGRCIRKRRFRTVGKPERITTLSMQSKLRGTKDYQTLVLEKEPDDAETGIDESVFLNSSGRRRIEVVGKDGLIDLEKELTLLRERKNWSRQNQNKPKQSKMKLGEPETRTLYYIESESDLTSDAEEVQLRSKGDAANLAQSEVTASNGTFDGLCTTTIRESEVNGSSEEAPALLEEEKENPALSVKAVEVLVPSRVQWPVSLSGLSGGGQLVADLTKAWDGLAGRLAPSVKHTQRLLAALKLALSAMRQASEDGGLMLSRSLSVAYALADLQMDGVVIAAGLLHAVVEAGLVGTQIVERQLGSDVSRLLHDCMRFKRTLDRMDMLDEESARAVRQFCLSYHDIRAIIIEISVRLHQMRHVQELLRYQQQILALETLQIHAPLAYAVGAGEVSSELEDMAFKVILPDSYKSLDTWLRSHWPDMNIVLEECKQRLSSALEQDVKLKSLIENFTITGRVKSRFSTMKKLLKDGRKPEEIYDIVGLRVVVSSKPSLLAPKTRERGRDACYRVLEAARSIWREVPGRLKDYIAKPKANGYESLHVAVYLANSELKQPSMELQIRTSSMDSMANGGDASHSLYKGGVTDPEQVQQMKKLMMAAAEHAALSLKELTGEALRLNGQADKDQVFLLFDKNSDGEISMAEFQEVMGELGADQNEAHELMQLVDTNKDGSVSADEFAEFRKQVRLLQGCDKQFNSKLGWKLRDSDTQGGIIEDRLFDTNTRSYSNQSVQNGNLETPSTEGHGWELTSPVKLASAASQGDMLDMHKLNLKAGEFSEDQLQTGLYHPDFSLFDEGQKIYSPSSKETASIKSEEKGRVSSLDSPFAWNEAEAIRMERIENSSRSSTSNSELLERSLQSPSIAKKSVVVSRPIHTPDQQHIFNEETARDGSMQASEGHGVDTQMENIKLHEGLKALRRLIATRKIVAAHDLGKKLYKTHPGDTNVLVEYAYVERQHGDLVAAGALYSQAIKAFEAQKNVGYDYVRTLQAWGSIEAQARNAKRARVLFMESIRAARQEELRAPGSIHGASVYGLHAWARLEEQVGNWSKARDLLARAAEIQPGNAVVHQSRASLEAKAHNYGPARRHFRLAVMAAPNDVKCWHAWALFEASQGKRTKMRQYFQQALEVDPSSSHSLQAWAYQEALIGTSDSKSKARKLYERCVEIDPKNTYAWQAWAVMEQASGNYEKARELLENGLRVNPSCVQCLQAFACMERSCGKFDAALKLLRKALKAEPENAAVLMEAAFVEESLGNADAASKLFKLAGMVDKRKSRVRHQMFVSRKASRSEKHQGWVSDSKYKLKDKTHSGDVNMSTRARMLPSHLKWEGKELVQQLKTASVLGA